MSKVFFARVGTSGGRGLLEKTGTLFGKAGFEEVVHQHDLTAVKLHFGELGCSSFIPGFYIREVVKAISGCSARPFLTDSCVCYLGKRRNAYDHLVTAQANGFSLASTGAPLVIADGLLGSDVEPFEVSGKYFDHVDIAGAIAHADSLVLVSHVTGHGLTGFAGAFKNLGMGAVGRSVKLSIHELVRPKVDPEACDACSECLRHCPTDAITIDAEVRPAMIDLELCIGCGECITVCPRAAIKIEWRGDSERAQEKLAEAASAVIRQKKNVACFNYLLNVTPSCDCWQHTAAPMVADIGLLASGDPVAIDQASIDLVNDAPCGYNDKYSDVNRRFRPVGGGAFNSTLKYAEELGLGTRDYELIPV